MTEPRTWYDVFPVTRNWVYLDIANKAPLPAAVKTAWLRFLHELHETPGDKDKWKERAEVLREKIALLIGAVSSEIAFVKNTSEGLNIIAQSFPWSSGDSVVVHAREHPNNLYTWLNLRRRGVEVRVVESLGPDIDLNDILLKIGPSTRMVAISAVSYCTGQRFDLIRLSERCRQHRSLLVVDAVQALGVVPFNVTNLGVDALVCGPQKGLLCTHGLGFLYCSQPLVQRLTPPYAARSSLADQSLGCEAPRFHDDARRFEHGNLNYGGVYALDSAVDLITDIGHLYISDRVCALTKYLMELIDHKGLHCITPRADDHRAGIVVIKLDDLARRHAELKSKQFVLTAVEDGLRIAPHFYNTEEELEALVNAL